MQLRTVLAATAAFAAGVVSAFPNAPFVTSGRWIHDSQGNNFTYIGANWPGAADVMIPEGLQYQSVASIVSKLKSINMNSIRLTFPIELVDAIYANGGKDVTIQSAFTKALGSANGTKVYNQVISKNPQFSATTTRLQVFDAVAAECAKQGIYVHLDNHISKAMWCCSTGDGNSWFGDKYYNVDNWVRGLSYMATHAKSWPNFVSIGLRNELRSVATQPSPPAQAYNWSVWYKNMVAAADAVHAANPDILIFYSGLGFDTDLSPIPTGADLGNGVKFMKSNFAYSNKIVLELHNYQNSATSCDSIKSGLYNNGFKALDSTSVNVLPVVLTEFGYAQDSSYTGVYASCLRSYIPSLHAGWMVWVVSGSYYIREGIQDYEETWGMLDHTWSNWRSSAAISGGIGQMVKNSIAAA